jgi:hypothetical protein
MRALHCLLPTLLLASSVANAAPPDDLTATVAALDTAALRAPVELRGVVPAGMQATLSTRGDCRPFCGIRQARRATPGALANGAPGDAWILRLRAG